MPHTPLLDRLIAGAAMSAIALTTASAQTAAPSPPDDDGAATNGSAPREVREIPFAEFRALSDGRTLYFELEDGQLWGREYYVPGTQESVFIFADGECFEGYWTYNERYYCYHYREQPSCWSHFWEDGKIKVESRTGARQVVGKIVEREPLSCDPDLLSSLIDPATK